MTRLTQMSYLTIQEPDKQTNKQKKEFQRCSLASFITLTIKNKIDGSAFFLEEATKIKIFF